VTRRAAADTGRSVGLLLVRRIVVLLIGTPAEGDAGADVGWPVHERVESARPLQQPRRTDTRRLRYGGQEAL